VSCCAHVCGCRGRIPSCSRRVVRTRHGHRHAPTRSPWQWSWIGGGSGREEGRVGQGCWCSLVFSSVGASACERHATSWPLTGRRLASDLRSAVSLGLGAGFLHAPATTSNTHALCAHRAHIKPHTHTPNTQSGLGQAGIWDLGLGLGLGSGSGYIVYRISRYCRAAPGACWWLVADDW
jgi:hypothetical protein